MWEIANFHVILHDNAVHNDLTIEILNAFNVILRQWEAFRVGVVGVHQGAWICGVGHPEGVSQLMGRHYKQVVCCRTNMFSVLFTKTQLVTSVYNCCIIPTWWIFGPIFILIKVSVSAHALARWECMSKQSIGPIERIIVSMLYRIKHRHFQDMLGRMHTFIIFEYEYVLKLYVIFT